MDISCYYFRGSNGNIRRCSTGLYIGSVNSVLVASASMGAYQVTFSASDEAKKEADIYEDNTGKYLEIKKLATIYKFYIRRRK